MKGVAARARAKIAATASDRLRAHPPAAILQLRRPPRAAVVPSSTGCPRVSTRLLLIDDDERLCDMLAQYLAQAGYRVTARHTLADGLAEHPIITFSRK